MKYLGAILVLLTLSAAVYAEPYLAVKEGLSCGQCHVNKAGGGQRTAFGNIYAQQSLVVTQVSEPGAAIWTGDVFDRISIGGNGRFSARQFEPEADADSNLEFLTERVSLYGTVQLNDRVTLYIDQLVAPGSALNREAWGRVTFGNWHAKGGKIFLPFGWRLEDDSAFIRQATGINFASGDNGIEFGWGNQTWQWQFALTNGNGGGGEIDDGKFFTTRAEWIGSNIRAGFSAANNNTDAGERTLYGLFAGLNTGPVAWLMEWDRVEDEGFGQPDTEQDLGFIEANIEPIKGHNLKFTYEVQTFDNDQPDRARGSLVWEYFPWTFTQFRVGYRILESDEPVFDEGQQIFGQAHFYF